MMMSIPHLQAFLKVMHSEITYLTIDIGVSVPSWMFNAQVWDYDMFTA